MINGKKLADTRLHLMQRVHPDINQSVVYQHLGEIEEACQVKRLEREMKKPDVRQLHVIAGSRSYLLFFNYNMMSNIIIRYCKSLLSIQLSSI